MSAALANFTEANLADALQAPGLGLGIWAKILAAVSGHGGEFVVFVKWILANPVAMAKLAADIAAGNVIQGITDAITDWMASQAGQPGVPTAPVVVTP